MTSNNNTTNTNTTNTTNTNTTNNTNPFDFDVDFDKVQRRRDQYLAKKAAEKAKSDAALLSGMDADDSGDPSLIYNYNYNYSGTRSGSGGLAAGPPRLGGLAWFRGPTTAEDGKADGTAAPQVLYGGKRVTQWPYDDYHVVQQQFYVKLEESSSGAVTTGSAVNSAVNSATTNTTNTATNNNAATTLQRPPDPPDIPTAVRNLPLQEFEAKAEQRAIAIVGTWLFDCGLMDELLVHGGMATDEGRGNAHGGDKDERTHDAASVPSQEGVEIGGMAGFPIEGPSKMDKEMNKLKANSRRTLSFINARLNDGVAASGAEVQELVNAVNSTKDDLGRLRELSTYISNIAHPDRDGTGSASGSDSSKDHRHHLRRGDGPVHMERRQKFMLTKYPKLKKAINARRNLARCFRELDFYSQIPVTCERLRDDLHSAEWTDHEWDSLRDVSREHVELEIFLVEAEAGMKKRIDEETEETRGGGAGGTGTGGTNEPRGRNDSTNNNNTVTSNILNKARSSYIPSSGKLPHNYEEVDNFLHEHVKNVWELGDEIRLRIRSGIGTAFELAMNNPAAMVALVEAVEVYETAAEEYKTVHGEEAGHQSSNSLRFTDMRASALKQIYQDFELRGLEMFREIHETVSVVYS